MAAGLSLACAGAFIAAAPAQAATARPSARAVSASRAASDGAASGYKSFSSSAKTAGHTSVSTRSVLPEEAKASGAAAAKTIYVLADTVPCQSGKELGEGTDADPYCLLQSAVNAAVSGDTIQVWQDDDEDIAFHESVSIVGKTDLTIVGEQIGTGDSTGQGAYGINIQSSTDVTIQNLSLYTNEATTAAVTGSSGITFDQDNLITDGGLLDTLDIRDGSSDIAVTRSTIGNVGSGPGIDISAGTQNVTLASDVIYTAVGAGIEADTANGLDIVGDTVERGCGGAVDVTTKSTGVSIENNVFEASSTAATACAGTNAAYAPDVTVDVASAAGTTSDYNDFIFETDNTAAYSWSGTSYPTLAAFQAAVPQGAHDAVDPTRDAEMFLTPAGMDAADSPITADAVPVAGSLSIGTANAEAPGYLSTDFYGRASYTDRGALEYTAPSLTATLAIYQTGARSVIADADGSVEPEAYALYTFSWGDGTTSSGPAAAALVSHVYAQPGTYTATVTVTDVFGDSSSAAVTAPTAGTQYTPIEPVRVLDTRHGTGTGVVATVGAGKALALKVADVGQIPADATSVALNITVTDAQAAGYVAAYADGTSQPITSNVNFGKGKNVANMAIVPIGADGEVDFYNGGSGSIDLIADASGYFATEQADGYKPLTPVRVLDTRTKTGGHDAPLTAADPVTLKVTGVGGVPADAKAVEVNLTVASPTALGYVKAYPDGGTVPVVSNVNFGAGQVIANAAIVPIGADGDIDIALTGSGSARMVVDVDGYFSTNAAEAPSAYVAVAPFRWLDTRKISGGALPSQFYYPLSMGTDLWGNVLPTITGVVSNATVTAPTATSGDLVVFPDNLLPSGYPDIPSTSTLNFTENATVPNMEVTAPAADGDVDFLNQSAGSLQLIVDVSGYFESE